MTKDNECIGVRYGASFPSVSVYAAPFPQDQQVPDLSITGTTLTLDSQQPRVIELMQKIIDLYQELLEKIGRAHV